MKSRLGHLPERVALLALVLQFAVSQKPAPAQQPSTGSGVTTLSVSSRLTLVDVTVTDGKGRPVHGLKEADFSLKEDGKPQPLKNFEEIGGERPTKESGPQLPPEVDSDRPASVSNTRAINVLLFDQVATGVSRGLQPNPEALKYAKEASLSYLKSMPAGTQVAVLQMDAEGLHVIQGVTSDQDRLLAAVQSVPYRRVSQAYWEPPLLGLTDPVLCAAMNYQSSQAINTLNQAADFVSTMPGRKNLIWFTPGVPWLADYQLFRPIKFITACLTDYQPELQQAYARVASARIAVYPIDPRGVYNNPAGSASGGGSFTGFGFDMNASLDSGALEDVAKATGGKAYFSRNDLDGALRDATGTGAEYYALSYVPPLPKYDGKHHTIEVKVDRPGLQLQYRRGYTSLDPAKGPNSAKKEVAANAAPVNPLKAALAYGLPPATQLVFKVRALPSAESASSGTSSLMGTPDPALQGKPLVRYSVTFAIPPDQITLAEQPDGTRTASFELIVDAYDSSGKLLNSNAQKGTFTVRPEQLDHFMQKPVAVPVLMDLPIGELSIRAGVRDVPSGKLGVVEIPVTVVQPPSAPSPIY